MSDSPESTKLVFGRYTGGHSGKATIIHRLLLGNKTGNTLLYLMINFTSKITETQKKCDSRQSNVSPPVTL